MNNKFLKIIVASLIVALLGVGGYGYYAYQNRSIDTTDYTVLDNENSNFEYKEEVQYEYVEDRIEFSSEVEEVLANMSDEEKVAQLFVVSLDEYDSDYFNGYSVGGFVYSEDSSYSIWDSIDLMNEFDNEDLPLLRIADDSGDILSYYYDSEDTPYSIGLSGDESLNSEYINDISYELNRLSFNVVLAPSCNIATGDERSDADTYGYDSISNSDMIDNTIRVYKQNGIDTISNVFPYISQRDTNIDTLNVEDLLVFQSAIDGGSEAIMLSSAICRPITGSASIPVFLSENTMDVLRAKMGFDGLIVSPDLYDYRSSDYSYSEVCVKAIKSGVDILYNPSNVEKVYEEILAAVQSSQISETRLENVTGRILSLKLNLFR